MLYDNKRWDRDKISRGISLRALIAWLETMPPEQEYNYADSWRCVLGQYLASTGKDRDDCVVRFGEPPVDRDWLYYVAFGYGPLNVKKIFYPAQTFGAALERARECL